jgi:hypothetical protein
MINTRFSRQSFLGSNAQSAIEKCTVGIVGLCGGGGHIVQQLAHLGILHFVLYDGDNADESNLNRLVLATEADAMAGESKFELAQRRILAIRPNATVMGCARRWQDNAGALRGCDFVFGNVDRFSERQQLEAFCRRYLMPLIDIGMDVHQAGDEPPRMGGQVILSMPGHPCMFCMGFLNDEKLAREASQYGAAGGRPQVVWPNGVLASTAVGIGIALVTDWDQSIRGAVYLMYDGNRSTISPHPRMQYLAITDCPHYPIDQVGEPVFRRL